MNKNYWRILLRVLPLLLLIPLVYLVWFHGGEEKLQQSVSNINTGKSDLQGKAAPPFQFTKEHSWKGETFNLSQAKGKPVLLHFWATWCGPCVAEMPELLALSQKRSDITFIAIAVDKDWQTVSAFFERYKDLRRFPEKINLYLDPGGDVPDRYGTVGLPETYLLKPDLTVVTKLVGAQPWTNSRMQALLDSLREPKR